MQRISFGLVAFAGLADAAGVHPLAFYALVLAVPATAAAALAALAAAVDDGDPRATGRAWVQAAALLLVLLSAAVRAPVHGEGSVPRLAVSALVGCLLLFAGQSAVAFLPALRRRLQGRAPERSLTRV